MINLLTKEVTPEMIKVWKEVWNEYKDKLQPNRKSGNEVVQYLKSKYLLKELNDDKANQVVIDNVLYNKPYADKLPLGETPKAVTFILENIATGKILYEKQDNIFKGNNILIGVDLVSGFFCVEGSSLLWDELCAFQGLDEKDIQNYFCVAVYISSLKKFGLLEKAL
ncbi:MAG: hypothetical protein ACOWWR_07255 [Eubacteriales bacterium]